MSCCSKDQNLGVPPNPGLLNWSRSSSIWRLVRLSVDNSTAEQRSRVLLAPAGWVVVLPGERGGWYQHFRINRSSSLTIRAVHLQLIFTLSVQASPSSVSQERVGDQDLGCPYSYVSTAKTLWQAVSGVSCSHKRRVHACWIGGFFKWAWCSASSLNARLGWGWSNENKELSGIQSR